MIWDDEGRRLVRHNLLVMKDNYELADLAATCLEKLDELPADIYDIADLAATCLEKIDELPGGIYDIGDLAATCLEKIDDLSAKTAAIKDEIYSLALKSKKEK